MSLLQRVYDIVRSRLPRGKDICLHSWQTINYENYVDETLGISEYYEIGCYKCNKTRLVDPDVHRQMKKEGLLI